MKKMKLRSLFLTVLCGLMVAAGFTSCSDDDVDNSWKEGAKVSLPEYRAFVLSEGSYQKNNSHLFYVNPATDAPYASDIYEAQNGKKLGDTANDMVAVKGNIYVVVNVSKLLLKLNGSGVEVARYSFDDTLGEPRYIYGDDAGKLYVSSYGGYVSRFDAETLKLEASVKVDANPEEIAVNHDGLFVVCSGYGAGNTICHIDLNTFDKAESIKTVNNPQRLVEANNRLYILAGSPTYNPENYDYSTAVYSFDSFSHETKYIADATKIFASGENLYYANSVSPDWVNYTTSFNVYNYNTEQTSTWNLTNAPAALSSSVVYMIEQNPYDNSFYIGTTNYSENSTVYHFSKDGNFIGQFDAGGINANTMVFLKR